MSKIIFFAFLILAVICLFNCKGIENFGAEKWAEMEMKKDSIKVAKARADSIIKASFNDEF